MSKEKAPKDYRTYSLKYLKGHHPNLLKDPVHYWRAKTGIELIHKEPDLKEFEFIVKNWDKMPRRWKDLSDKKSIELFGKDNLSRIPEILKQYKL